MDAGEEAFDLEDEELLATDELDSDSDDSEKDPGYEPLEEARSRLSRLSLNRSSPRCALDLRFLSTFFFYCFQFFKLIF